MPPYGRRGTYSLPHSPHPGLEPPKKPWVAPEPPAYDGPPGVDIALGVDGPVHPVAQWVIQSKPLSLAAANDLRAALRALGYDTDVIALP